MQSTAATDYFKQAKPQTEKSNSKSDLVSPAVTPQNEIRPKHTTVVEIPVPSQSRPAASIPKDSTTTKRPVEILSHVEIPVHVRPQKEVVRSSLQRFQNALLALFEAQDALDSNADGEIQIVQYFDSRPDDESPFRVTKSVLENLLVSVKFLVNHKALDSVSFDHLRRLQNICQPAVEQSQFSKLSLETEVGEDELLEWRIRAVKAENALLSASLVLWTILADPHNPDLFPEEVIKWIPNVLINVFENCLIPVVESRPENKDQQLYNSAREVRDPLKALLEAAQRLLDILSTICVTVRDGESAVNAVEYLAVKLIFVENASSEKASVFGIQAYEKTRKSAMGAVAKIYARFPGERPAILREILHSLSKLPSTSRSARQYKTAEGKNIQLITALMMQLVQTTMMRSPKHDHQSRLSDHAKSKDNSDSEEDESEMRIARRDHMFARATNSEKLKMLANERFDDGAKSALGIVHELVGKASITSKSSENNYRNLFDLFVEDLLNVCELPDWPAAELLLRLIAQRLINIVTSSKTGASAKNMALENLGEMGSLITKMQISLRRMIATIEQEDDSDTARLLTEQARSQDSGGLRLQDLISKSGPFSIVYEYLQQSSSENLRQRSARSFCLTHWAILLSRTLNSDRTTGGEDDRDHECIDEEQKKLIDILLRQLSDEEPSITSQRALSSNLCRLANLLILANSGFCRRLGEIVKTLSTSLSSDQAQVRSRSIKSVVSILETDSSLLDRDASIIDDVFAAASDESAMVRDAALSLIAKFIVTRPALQEQGIKCLLDCTSDSKVGVQKRSMGQLKEIYVRDDRPKLQAAIAAAFLRRLRDVEESVSEMALKLLSEIWMSPHVAVFSTDASTAKAGVRHLSEIMLATLSQAPDQLEPLIDQFIASIIKAETKNLDKFLELFAHLVTDIFETVIAGTENLAIETKQAGLVLLQLFAHHSPRSVTANQLTALKPYLGNLTKQDDLNAFRPVVAIFKLVLPFLSSTQKHLIHDIQVALMKSISRLARRAELDEVTSCLWAIDGVLHNSERLIHLTKSVLEPLIGHKTPNAKDLQSANEADVSRLKGVLDRQKSYLRIIGSIGKEWKLEPHTMSLKRLLPSFKGESAATFITHIVQHFTSVDYSNEFRAIAYESLGSVCQGSPEQFKKHQIIEAFRRVFRTPASESALIDLEKIVLQAFAGMMGSREERKDSQTQDGTENSQPVIEKMGGDVATQEHDAAASQIAQKFFDDIVRAALGTDAEKALIATRVVVSINRQGLVHPKQCVGPLIALETCPERTISDLAYESHKMMHQQHESTYERQYVDALKEAFMYASTTLNDTMGASRAPYASKLSRCFEVVNTSTSKHVKRFLSVLVSATNADFSRLAISVDQPEHLLFSRFVAQNLAFFDYIRLDELLHTILQIELLFSKSGADLAHAIEGSLQLRSTTILDASVDGDEMLVDPEQSTAFFDSATTEPIAIDPTQLKQFATGAAVLSMMWETRSHLKRQFAIQGDIRLAINHAKQTKVLDKPPAKLYAVTGDGYWNNIHILASASLSSTEAMLDRCRDFVDLVNVDTDLQVEDNGDGAPGNRDRYSGSVEDDDQIGKLSLGLGSGSGRGRKRKNTGSIGGSATATPTKKRMGRPSLKLSNSNRRGSTSSRDDPDADFEE